MVLNKICQFFLIANFYSWYLDTRQIHHGLSETPYICELDLRENRNWCWFLQKKYWAMKLIFTWMILWIDKTAAADVVKIHIREKPTHSQKCTHWCALWTGNYWPLLVYEKMQNDFLFSETNNLNLDDVVNNTMKPPVTQHVKSVLYFYSNQTSWSFYLSEWYRLATEVLRSNLINLFSMGLF